MKLKKILAAASAVAMSAGTFNVVPAQQNGSALKTNAATTASNTNYGEALQKFPVLALLRF